MMFISYLPSRFVNFNLYHFYFDYRLLQCVFFSLLTFLFVQGNVEVCYNVQPPFLSSDVYNCTLVCSLKFQYVVSDIHNDELALCIKNSSIAVHCNSHVDCRQHHIGAYCKIIPCLCKADKFTKESYIFHSSVRMPKLNSCVVPARHINPDLPVVPFPWKTLLVVAAIVFVFATCLICLRWLSPLIRSMQAKRTTRENRERQQLPEDNASLFPSVPHQSENGSTPFSYYFPRGMPRIYRANPRSTQNSNRASSRAVHYATCSQGDGTLSGTLSNQDKPPPYETAIQLPPPAYEDVERAIRESGSDDFRRNNQCVEVHAVPPSGTTQTVNLSSLS